MTLTPQSSPSHLPEVIRLFLRLGFTAFGGPAAHIALFRQEIVQERQWVTDEHFLDLLGATNLIPGPNSTEMAIHLGYVRAGWRGLIAGGLCFVMPAVLIVLALAWVYVEYGTTPAAESMLYGIKPVIIAVVLQALWALSRKAITGRWLVVIAVGVLALYLLGINEILLIFGGGLVYTLVKNLRRLPLTLLWMLSWWTSAFAPLQTSRAEEVSLTQLFLIFLKIGAVLYGSGYVLLAFLQNDLVDRTGWLTQQQLLDAVAIGQFTPGPLFTTATFIGYVIGGVPGAIVATLGIFLPSFLLVALTNPLIPRMRRSAWLGALLDGVNVAALGLMAGVTLELGVAALVDIPTVLLAIGAAILMIRYKVNSTWVIIGGALIGIVVGFLG